MKHLLTNSNKNNKSLVQSAEEDRTFDRQARKQEEKYGKNELVPRAREDRSVVKQAGRQEKSAGKNELKPSRERTELPFNRRENMLLLAPNVKYSIPVCKKIKAREK